MNSLTEYLNELRNDANLFSRFAESHEKSQDVNYRKEALTAAGVDYPDDLLQMSSSEFIDYVDMITAQSGNKALKATISGLMVEQAFAHPLKVAIIDGEKRINYQTLFNQAAKVSGSLSEMDIKKGALVGVCMKRSWELIATLIGVMQAGCAYVPLDPGYPADRIKYMLTHSGAAAAITDNDKTAKLCEGVEKLLFVNELSAAPDYKIHSEPRDLAYVIYTSGSTGRPKGVAVAHKSLPVLSETMSGLFSGEELSGFFAGASVCFDTSVMETMGVLSLGGTIILAQNALELMDLPALAELKTCVMVASSMQALLATNNLPSGIKCLVFGGEALKRSLVEQVRAQNPNLRVLNAYGPTEDTVFSTIADVKPGTQVVTIGNSVSQSVSYILDEEMNPVADGEEGELYLAGAKLAVGYLHDEALTKERFIEVVPNDIIRDNRLYRTGDLCRRLPSGEIEFLGRVDQQVKIRGFRIELGEIESTLELMEGIDAAAATTIEGGAGQKMLIAYVVKGDDAVTEAAIKAYLGDLLPKYMIPQVFRFIDALPFLPNDKLDRKKLKELYQSNENLTQTESSLVESVHAANPGTAQISQDAAIKVIREEAAALLNLAGTDLLQVDQPFDSVGLDSLSTLEFSSRLSAAFSKKIPAKYIFDNPTPLSLAHRITHMETLADSDNESQAVSIDTLSNFQVHIQSSHPTFQAAKANAWNANDKSMLVQEVLKMVNDDRRNPYSKVLKTGSATKGIVGDAYNDEEKEAIIWTTNLYLGLNRDPEVMQEASAALASFGTGMGTSAAASGMTDNHLEFEKEFADLTGKPAACLFPTGYTANVGAVAGLLGKDDVVVIDQLCHASIVDGARLCGATIRTFQHNNKEDLEAVLKSEVSPYKTILVVLEGVYSMGEGAAPVAEIVRTAKKYEALVLVDEAHSFGFYGEGGAGICAEQGVTEEVDFIMTTLSKALGSLGGVVSASQEHVDLLKASSRAYIFQASVSPADMAAALTALRRLRADDALRQRLWDTTRYMRQRFEEAGYDLGTGDGPIVTPHFSDKDKLYAIVQNLYQRGIQTSAVTYPIVESGRGRLRLICSAAHTIEDVDKTLQGLIDAEKEVDGMLANAEKTHKQKQSTVLLKELNDWAVGFTSYLEEELSAKTTKSPDLAITLGLANDSRKLNIRVKGGQVVLTKLEDCQLPVCSMTLSDDTALKALWEADMQKLLQCICNDTCVLHGQVEPFIWFVGRLVGKRKSMEIAAVSTKVDEAGEVALI
ncbi:MAG: amino acid adenylation domain-containing protein [Bacteroidota bacterium]